MSFAFMPFYTGDYIRDTRGLSMSAHGCYVLLLMFCWDTQGPLPLDEEHIAGICNARSNEERTTMSRILSSFFVRMEDGFYNKRIQMEIERASAISLKRKSAGAKGYQAKAKHLLGKSKASAGHLPLHSQPHSHSQPQLQELVTTEVDGERERKKGRKPTRLMSDDADPNAWEPEEKWILEGVAITGQHRDRVLAEGKIFACHFAAARDDTGVKKNWHAAWLKWMHTWRGKTRDEAMREHARKK